VSQNYRIPILNWQYWLQNCKSDNRTSIVQQSLKR